MKKILRKVILTVFLTLTCTMGANANIDVVPANVYAVVQSPFDYHEIQKNDVIDLIAFKDCGLNEYVINRGDKLSIVLNKYVKPKRGKRNGYYKITLSEINSGKIKTVYQGTMRISEPKDLSEIVEKAGITIVGAALKVPGFSQSIAIAKGIVSPNEDQTRLKSACHNLYESTPLPLVKRGDDFSVETDAIVVLRLRERNSSSRTSHTQ